MNAINYKHFFFFKLRKFILIELNGFPHFVTIPLGLFFSITHEVNNLKGMGFLTFF